MPLTLGSTAPSTWQSAAAGRQCDHPSAPLLPFCSQPASRAWLAWLAPHVRSGKRTRRRHGQTFECACWQEAIADRAKTSRSRVGRALVQARARIVAERNADSRRDAIPRGHPLPRTKEGRPMAPDAFMHSSMRSALDGATLSILPDRWIVWGLLASE